VDRVASGRGRTRRFASLVVLFVCLSTPAAGANATAHARTIVFSVFSGLPVSRGDERCEGLYSVEADGSDLRRLTAPGASGNGQLFPSLAGNGRTLLFARFSDAAGDTSTLYRLDGDDGAVVGLAQVRAYPLFLRFPWSPRGPYVLIPQGRGTSRLEIQRLDARNGRRLRLTAGAGDLWPTWSPDGAAIAFTRRSRAATTADAVWLMAADGSQERGLWDYFVQTAHPGTIQLDGDTAVGRAYISELGHLRDGRSELNYAVYRDRYRRTTEGWKFAERVYEVRYIDTTPLPGSAPARGVEDKGLMRVGGRG
jgi:SnoaL-like domain/WD40-like Beta Propeller Repeat